MGGYAIREARQEFQREGVQGLTGFFRDIRQLASDRTALRSRQRTSIYGNSSSISDMGLYPRFCRWAAEDESVFSRFRRSLIYRGILEHVSEEQGLQYLAEIGKSRSGLGEFATLIESDFVGNPLCFSYGDIGPVSPTLLRYIKVASDLQQLFGSLDGMSIAEIGIGYGGQCRVLESAWAINSYTLYDVPEVLALAGKFLEATGVSQMHIAQSDGRKPMQGVFDLVISNYAFSELRRESQEAYMERVIDKSIRGYVTYNHISPVEWNSLSADEFAARIPGAQVLEEIPLTHPENVIVAWGLGTEEG